MIPGVHESMLQLHCSCTWHVALFIHESKSALLPLIFCHVHVALQRIYDKRRFRLKLEWLMQHAHVQYRLHACHMH